MINRDQILNLVKLKGPVVPTDITSELKENTIIVGAYLSELVSAKLIKISHAKVGGSPLYYLETQKTALSKLYSYLNEKDKIAYDLLKNEEVIFDSSQTPLMRTALRNIPDFAKSFKVTYKGQNFLFWNWYLSSEEVIRIKVKDLLKRMFPEDEKKTNELVNKKKAEDVAKPENSQTAKPEVYISTEDKKTNQQKLFSNRIIKSEKNDFIQSKDARINDDFFKVVDGYLNSLSIKIISSSIKKKNKELDLIVSVPSTFGDITYFCKARNKKKSTEGDVAQSFVEGQLLGYPVIYLSFGDVPKKVYSLIDTKYKNLKLIKI